MIFEKKEALLKTYYEITQKLSTEISHESMDLIEMLLNERQQLIKEVSGLDEVFGSIIMNENIKQQLLQVQVLEETLHTKLRAEKQNLLTELGAIKKEKSIKQHYGEQQSVTHSGVFYDKRK